MSDLSSKQQEIEKRLAFVSRALQQALEDLERVQTLLQRDLSNGYGVHSKQREVHRLLEAIGENLSETAIGFGMITQPTETSSQSERAD